MNFFHSIKFRFTIWYLMALVILLGTLSTLVYFSLSRSLYQNLDHDLELRSTQLLTQLQNSSTPIEDIINSGQFQEKLGEVVMLCYYSGDTMQVLPPKNANLPEEHSFIDRAISGEKSFDTVRTTEGERMRFSAVPVQLRARSMGMTSTLPATLIVGRSTDETEHALDGLIRILLIAVPLTLILATGGGVFLAGRALKPVDKISLTARMIGEGDLNQRIEVNTKDELGRLASTLNQMIDRLQKALKRQQQLTSDASHELRAPLAVIQAESSLSLQKERSASEYKQSLETVTEEASHMSSIIDRLLFLARADAGKEQLVLEEVNLGKLLRELTADVKILCQQKGLELKQGDAFDFTVKGDRSMLRQLFLNLLDNAIRYTPGGGTISVTFSTDGRKAAVAIADTGIGIPPEDLPHIFERFYRVDKARSRADGGSGLGLSICHYIAEAHNGKIEVESQLGKGSTFTVWLPGHGPA